MSDDLQMKSEIRTDKEYVFWEAYSVHINSQISRLQELVKLSISAVGATVFASGAALISIRDNHDLTAGIKPLFLTSIVCVFFVVQAASWNAVAGSWADAIPLQQAVAKYSRIDLDFPMTTYKKWIDRFCNAVIFCLSIGVYGLMIGIAITLFKLWFVL